MRYRTRMSWNWVNDYPIFVYTTWIDHFKFDVKVVKGKRGDQNAKGFGPSAPAWITYVQEGYASKDEVTFDAFNAAARKLEEEQLLTEQQAAEAIFHNAIWRMES